MKRKFKPEPLSPALTVIRDVARHEGDGLGRSRDRYNHALLEVVRLCIGFSVPFALHDFTRLARSWHGHDLDGDAKLDCEWCNRLGVPRYHVDEWAYALACGRDRGRGSRTAIAAIEAHWKRKPFLIEVPKVATRQRVYVGFSFRWLDGQQYHCTSFAEDQSAFIACRYAQADIYSRRTPAGRIRVTHDQLAEFNAQVVAAKKASLAPAGGSSDADCHYG